MGKVIGGMTMSLDGYVSDPKGGLGQLYPDMDALHNSEVLQEEIRTTGAVILGRTSYDMAPDPDFYADGYEYQTPLFVVTHRVPDRKPKENDRLTITFVTEGIERAVEMAKAAAGDRNVLLIGASMNQQGLNAGLVDELHMGIMPVLLGSGLRLFDHVPPARFRMEKIRVLEDGERTDIWYRVVY
ncbi:MAG: dihydrofolate reductase family protein [Chloroflexi bacterium]|nr:dihydrofolate reductase family protein [Chloroflexota bacterium]